MSEDPQGLINLVNALQARIERDSEATNKVFDHLIADMNTFNTAFMRLRKTVEENTESIRLFTEQLNQQKGEQSEPTDDVERPAAASS